MRHIFRNLCIALIGFAFAACNKSSFLDAKPDNSLVVPATLVDLQALLDNDIIMNGSTNRGIGGPNPQLLIDGTDDFYVTGATYNKFSLFSRNVYIWSKEDPYGGETSILDWSYPYRAVFYANVALDGLSKVPLTGDNRDEWKNVKGSALFLRAYEFYQLSQVFAPPFNKETASADPGIPLRLKGDISAKTQRATLKQTYDRIISDLKTAVRLLPDKPLYRTRPSRPAAWALLARTYLAMEDYDLAWLYADSCLGSYTTLIDYNTLDAGASNPLTFLNDEVIFGCVIQYQPPELFYPYYNRVDSVLHDLYQQDDLRKQIFFTESEPGRFSFKGSYDGTGFPFTGIATDEIYLIRAECYARKGNAGKAMEDLNTLLEERWKEGAFVPLTAGNPEEALKTILQERRKELIFRGLRWTDLRRLNKDPRFAKTLVRMVNGKKYTLPPNDARYTWPIPAGVIGFNPGMPQNPR